MEGFLANEPCPPMSDGRQAWGSPWWGARIGTLECSLWLWRDCPTGYPQFSVAVELITPGSHEAWGIQRQRKKRGGLPRLPLIRGTCRQRAPPSLSPSVRPPPLSKRMHAHSSSLAAVIIAIASLDFHSWARSCTACLLMRNLSYDPEVFFIYLIIYSTQRV